MSTNCSTNVSNLQIAVQMCQIAKWNSVIPALSWWFSQYHFKLLFTGYKKFKITLILMIKFIYSEKATKFSAFSEYMNFKKVSLKDTFHIKMIYQPLTKASQTFVSLLGFLSWLKVKFSFEKMVLHLWLRRISIKVIINKSRGEVFLMEQDTI